MASSNIGWLVSYTTQDVTLPAGTKLPTNLTFPDGTIIPEKRVLVFPTLIPAGTAVKGFTFNSWRGCVEKGDECKGCLDPQTPILYADMIWRPIGDVQVGDLLAGFDEYPQGGQPRKLRPTVVEAAWWSRKPGRRVVSETSDLVTTDDHRWLSHHMRRWVSTDRLRRDSSFSRIEMQQAPEVSVEYRRGYLAGMTAGDGTFRYTPGQRSDKLGFPQPYWRVAVTDEEILGRLVAYLATFGVIVEARSFTHTQSAPHATATPSYRPMRKVEVRALGALSTIHNLIVGDDGDPEFRRGYIAGIFDAEGSNSASLRISQKSRALLEQVRSYAASLGFTFILEEYAGADRVATLRLVGSVRERMRFFGFFRPAVARKLQAVWDTTLTTDRDPLLAVESVGMRDVIDIQTSTGTFFANGLATHNCYAEAMWVHRYGHDVWGQHKAREIAAEAYWRNLAKWDAFCALLGARGKVFWGSLMDFAEMGSMANPHEVAIQRQRMFGEIVTRRNLDFLALTKRPQNIAKVIPPEWMTSPPDNVWWGTSVGWDKTRWRIEALRQAPGVVHFISAEPLIGALDLRGWLDDIEWCIIGGESSDTEWQRQRGIPRPMDPAWVDDLIAVCQAAGVATFFKQKGTTLAAEMGCSDRKGEILSEFPLAWQIRELPEGAAYGA